MEKSGISLSNLLPHTAKIVDDICVIHSAHTEAINHDPAITLIQTGSQLPGRPSIGSWLDYGLGSANKDLPAFVVLNSVPSEGTAGQGLLARLWGAGFLPSRHQGVQFRSSGDPVLYLSDPAGITRDRRRKMLDGIAAFNSKLYERVGDPEIETRIEQYEMAFRMQASVPELMDTSHESDSVYDLYGPASRTPGTFAANCLLARRLAERDVRFIQLYHRGWDHHGELPKKLPVLARDTDQPSAALVRGLEATGPFGRHACHLGRRIRSDALRAGQAQAGSIRARPSWQNLFAVDGRRRSPRRTCARQIGRLRIQHRRRPGPRSRHPGDHYAPDGHRITPN